MLDVFHNLYLTNLATIEPFLFSCESRFSSNLYYISPCVSVMSVCVFLGNR